MNDNARMYLTMIALIADLLNPETDLHTVDRDRFGIVLAWLSRMMEKELEAAAVSETVTAWCLRTPPLRR